MLTENDPPSAISPAVTASLSTPVATNFGLVAT
jgi:hypothetical protein